MEKIHTDNVKHFLNMRIKREGHQMTKYADLVPSLYFKVPGSNISQLKALIGAVLNISKNFRSKGQGHQMAKCGQKCRFGATCTLQRLLKANV